MKHHGLFSKLPPESKQFEKLQKYMQTLSLLFTKIKNNNWRINNIDSISYQSNVYKDSIISNIIFFFVFVSRNRRKSIWICVFIWNDSRFVLNICSMNWNREMMSQNWIKMKIIFHINECIKEISFSLYSNESINFELGNIYRKGKILQQDINKAIHFYKLAAKQNVLEAQQSIILLLLIRIIQKHNLY